MKIELVIATYPENQEGIIVSFNVTPEHEIEDIKEQLQLSIYSYFNNARFSMLNNGIPLPEEAGVWKLTGSYYISDEGDPNFCNPNWTRINA